ncbi:Salicylate 5-hydroxylase, large oxygenase component [compost metagenome]
MATASHEDRPVWADDSISRIPFRVYTDTQLYQRELERCFYQGHWNYVGLEAEIPHPGDFKRTTLGERSVILVRDQDGEINVIENVCAHRGMKFCRERSGNRKDFHCPYHQWNYDLKGNLQGVPLRRGVKQDGKVNGGMPADFRPQEHGLTQLKVLGYNKQRIPGNWKLMQENIKDPYHPGLLHTWFVTFGLWRADNKARLVMDAEFRHAAMVSTRGQGGKSGVTSGVSSFKDHMALHDDRILDIVHEPWWGEPTAVMMTVFPSVIFQQQVNSVSTRHIQPNGPDSFDFVWTHFGFEDDTGDMTRRRLRQANLFGPAGFVSADDGEAIECSQEGFTQKPWHRAIAELGGKTAENTEHMVTETLIRGMYAYWRKVMEV